MLPYLGIERQYTEEEMSRIAKKVGNYRGYSVEKAVSAVEKLGLGYEIVGDGKTVTSQVPAAGETLTNINGKVILYTGGATGDKMVKVPDITGMNVTTAIRLLQSKNLNVLIEGAQNYNQGSGATVISQSVEKDIQVHEWEVITIVCRYLDDSDETVVE